MVVNQKSTIVLITGIAALVVALTQVLEVQAQEAGKPAVGAKQIQRYLAKSSLVKATDALRHVELTADVTGLKTITLESLGVDGNSFDWVGWVELKFQNAAGKSVSVGKDSVLKVSQGYGEVKYDTNIEGKPLTLTGKVFHKGIGTHADSAIQIKVPKGAVKFVAIAGLDDQGAIRDGKLTKASVQFAVINDRAPWEPKLAAEFVPLDQFKIPKDDDLEVTLWAKSPQFYNPTNMAIDHKGRIWLTEGVNYRYKKGRRSAGDRIMVLEDTDGDGVADSSHCFVQDAALVVPLGIAVFENKVIVSSAPNLIVYTDVNNDLKFDPAVDKKEVLLTGFQGNDHDHALHSLTAGPDGKFYFNAGNCGGKFTDKSGNTFYMNGAWSSPWNVPGGKKSDDGFLWTCGFGVRMNPDGSNVEIFGHGFRNSYEQSINSLGDIFQNDNDDVDSCRNSYVLEYGCAGFFTRDGRRMWTPERRPGQTTGQAHWRQDDPGTFDVGDIYGLGSPTGNVIYENGALGEKWEGVYLAAEAARNTIFGYHPQEKGATFQLDRFDFLSTNLAKQFIGGDFTERIGDMGEIDNKGLLFRPVDLAVGPDGALYVADWYDGRVGGHATMDDSCSGAIYRIAPKGFKPSIPAMDLTTVKGQVEALKSPAINVRHLGFTRLRDGKERSLAAVLEVLAHPNKYVSSRAIWLLPYLGEQGLKKCEELLNSDKAEQRLVAFRALRRADANILPYAKLLVKDSNTAVRRDVALALRHYSAEETLTLFIELAKAYDGMDKNYLEAIGLGAENKEDAIWLGLKKAMVSGDVTTWSENFVKLTWRLWPAAAIDDLKARAESSKLTQEQRDFAVESLAFIHQQKSANTLLDLAADGQATKKSARYWLFKRGTGIWSHMGLRPELKKRGIYDPETIAINSITVPEPPKTSSLPSVAEIAKLKGDPVKGKSTIMRCVICHNINGVGPDYGPVLKGFGATQSKHAIIKSIIEPSAGIAYSFHGSEITLKEGGKLHGIIIPGDPYIVTSTGGVTQMVPKSRVAKVEHMNRSLMMSADQLGLSAQDVADITAFMQQWN